MDLKIEKYVVALSLEEKAAQLFQTAATYLHQTTAENTGLVETNNKTKAKFYNVGSILNFVGATEMKELSSLCIENSTAKIPPIFMHDVVHGYKTIYPIPLAMAGAFDEKMVEDCCEMAAKEATVGGVQVTFAPMVDLVRDARWGRVMESSGEDPYLNGVMGRAQIRGFKKGGLMSCVKHFAGYGAAEAGRDYNTTDISDYNLYEYYLRAYEECIKEKPEMVMTSFNLLNGIPVNGHTDLLIELLREKWGFDGVVISDYNAVAEMIAHGYAENEEQCAEIALNNEVDIEMVSSTYMDHLPNLVKWGRVSSEKVDRMLRRVLKLKEQAGLFKVATGKADENKEKELYLCEEHRELARKAAEKCIVLLKNDGILPLNPTQEISLVGRNADEQNLMGEWHCHGEKEDCVSVSQGLKNLLGYSLNQTQSQTVIACIGEKSEMSGEAASKTNINLASEDVALIKDLFEQGKKVIAVIFAGRPLVLTEIEPYCNAIVYAWFLGTESGNAIANVLYGKAMPSAKLTMSFPRAVGQCPIYYNSFRTGRPKSKDDYCRTKDYCSSYQDEYNSSLYPFGYGLTYGKIQLSDLLTSSNTIKKDGEISVSITVENIGEYACEEVIQLYIRDKVSIPVRPIKELKGYKKVSLRAGEKKIVSFILTEEMLKFYKTKDKFVSEEGEFEIMVGCNSRDYLSTKLQRI